MEKTLLNEFQDMLDVLNVIPEPVCIVGKNNGNMIIKNIAFDEMCGFNAGTNVIDFIADYDRHDKNKDFICDFKKPNGEKIEVKVVSKLLKYRGHEAFVLHFKNLTKQKSDEKVLYEAARAAEEASELKSRFLANMSHEIRTPMNAIKGLAELLALTELNTIQDSYVRNIVKSSNTLLSIINDVLDFTKINKNKIEFVEGQYLLEDLISEVSNAVSIRAAEKGLLMLMDISPSLPKGLIGDDVRVKQVMINILNNAVKYTPNGRIIFKLWGEETDNGFELICSVEDTGIGIKSEDIPFLFEAFSQADRQVNHHIQGTGLGLSICDQLIRRMGGSITVESEHGKGSIFTVRFPQGVHNSEPLAVIDNPEKYNILLPESDSGSHIQYVTHMLDSLGIAYTITSADDFTAIGNNKYTHCICDGNLSDISIRRIRVRLPGCVFIAVKDMRYAMNQSELHDSVLFVPLLVTELVKTLTKVSRQDNAELNTAKTIDDFALADTHFLVVDDNEINLIVSGEILRAYKAEVACAESGREAIKLCEEDKYDMIFMDHMMPEMDGIETTVEIRKGSGVNKSTPIIALTANVVNNMSDYYIQNGMDDFIGKPIELDELSRILLKWLPENKITSMDDAVCPKNTEADKKHENTMERLILSLDAFGMYVSDVMREINNDYNVYIYRMDRIRAELASLVSVMREQVRDENWDEFAENIWKMASMIHDVGARDCSGRARKLANAAREHNADYIKSDFFSLMDNMYMLEKKIEVALPLALGNISPDVPFGDMNYCYERLNEMNEALANRDYETCVALLDSLAHYSLDHALDLILVAIGARLSEHNFTEASILHAEALDHCINILNIN